MQTAGNFVCFIYGMKTKTRSQQNFKFYDICFINASQVSIYMIYTYMIITVYYSCMVQKENYAAGIAVLTNTASNFGELKRNIPQRFPNKSHSTHCCTNHFVQLLFIFTTCHKWTNGWFNTITSVFQLYNTS